MDRVTNFKLGIGIPLTWPYVPSGFFDTFITMQKPDFSYIPGRGGSGSIDELRNKIVSDALELGCSHLWMIDADMKYHPMTILRLLEHGLPVVGGLCYRRYPPFDPLLLKGTINEYQLIEKWEEDELVEVDATGTGCLLFHMNIFRKIPPPWFEFRPIPDQEKGGVIGEDIGFCHKLREAGYRIFVDTSIPSGHLTMFEVTDNAFRIFRKLQKLKALDKNSEAVT